MGKIKKGCRRDFVLQQPFLIFIELLNFFLTVGYGAHTHHAQQQCHKIKGGCYIQNDLITGGVYHISADFHCLTEMIYYPGGKLIAAETCKGPCGKGNAVECAYAAHAIVIREQRGDVGKAAAVARIDHHDENQNQSCGQLAFCTVSDAAGNNNQGGKGNGENEY